MTASEALPYVSYVLDTALSPDHNVSEVGPGTWLVGWQCGFEPMFVAVIASYTEAQDAEDAASIAQDYLGEIGWGFPEEIVGRNVTVISYPDYIFRIE